MNTTIEGVFKTRGIEYATAGAAAELLNLKSARIYQLIASEELAAESVLGLKLKAIRLSVLRAYQKQQAKNGSR